MISTPVLIIGAGPSGMVSALLLAKNGIPSVLVEKRAIPGKHPKAHEISGRTLEILNTAGIPIEELESEASPHEDGSRIIFCRTIKEEIGRVDLNDPVIQKKYQDHSSLSSPYLNLSQTALESIIRKYVLENKLITYKNNYEWVSFEKTNQKIISKLNFEAKEILIESDYTLCCEGAGGQCRNALGITMKGPEKIREFANIYFTNDLSGILPTKAKLFFIFRPDSAGILIAHHSKKRWVYHVPLLVHEKISDYTESKFISNLQKIFDDPNFIPKIGFFVANDLSSRSLAVLGEGMVNRYEYWGMSKSFSNFLPVSENIWIPKNFVENAIPCVSLKTTLNDEERQNEKTSGMIFTPKLMLHSILQNYPNDTLKKGDRVIMGTPGGIALVTPRWKVRLANLLGFNRFTKLKIVLKAENKRFLKPGDKVTVSGEWLGEVEIIILK